jgi:hypothetical protein
MQDQEKRRDLGILLCTIDLYMQTDTVSRTTSDSVEFFLISHSESNENLIVSWCENDFTHAYTYIHSSYLLLFLNHLSFSNIPHTNLYKQLPSSVANDKERESEKDPRKRIRLQRIER